MNEHLRKFIALFTLFWAGAVTLVVGVSYVLNGFWYIFARWFELNYPVSAGIYCPPNTTCILEWGSVIENYMPVAIEGAVIATIGLIMMSQGVRKSTNAVARFALFWAGIVTLGGGLATFLFGFSSAAFLVWHEINFPSEAWVPQGVARGLWYPQLRYNMPYMLTGLVIMMMGILMMKNGQRKISLQLRESITYITV